jgi:hypothetical protein
LEIEAVFIIQMKSFSIFAILQKGIIGLKEAALSGPAFEHV